MADNVNVTEGAGKVIAGDDVGGAIYQRIKVAHGADGSATDTSTANPLPVVQTGTPGLPTGAATAANQATAIGHLATIAGVAGDALTDAELRASPVPVIDSNSAALLAAAQAIQTAAQILDNIVAGNEAQVDIVAALPAGTNNIGDVDVLTLPALAAGTNNIGDVDVLSIAAGENLIGLVGTSDIVVTVTPTCDTNAYTSGDLLFDSTEVANAVRANGYSCVLQSITIVDKDDQKAAMTLLIADTNTDFGTLNSAPDPDDTEAATVIGWVPVVAGDYVDLGGASVACIRNIGLTLKAGASATSLYVAGITGGTPTHSASGLVLKLGILRS